MFPVVPVPDDASIKRPLELKLKPGWRYESRRRVFTSDDGESFAPGGELPKYTKIVYQLPELSAADPSGLSEPERDLQRYMHIVLPSGKSPEGYVAVVSQWPCVAEANAGPEISLP